MSAPLLFSAGAALFSFIMPLALQFFIGMGKPSHDGADIVMMNRGSEYLGFVMALMLAFGLLQLPIILSLLGRVGLVTLMVLSVKKICHRHYVHCRCFPDTPTYSQMGWVYLVFIRNLNMVGSHDGG